jgi:hypothetical protein
MTTRRHHFLLRCLTGRPGLMALAVLAAMAWHQTVRAASLPGEDGAVTLPLAELAVPQTAQLPYEAGSDGSTVLRPSCTPFAPDACARLAEICTRLDGALESHIDGGQTCVIVLE